MRCATCAAELIPGKRFCAACGSRVEPGCANCGAPFLPEYRFCPECGSQLPSAATDGGQLGDARLSRLTRHVPEDLARKIRGAGATAGERKVVTVLFCDLVGSTAIAEGLDPEEYRELLDRYLELAFQEIYRVDGIVNQLAGDGLMALFGAPVAHEDAPYRAVRAAWEIQERMRRFDAGSAAGRGFVVAARVGIHTGPVVVGTVGNDFKMDYTAVGDTTNLAARLQSFAEPGTILVSEATFRLVRGFFETVPAGVFQVKGKAAPVAAHRILRATAITSAIGAAAARGLTPLVGRSEELALLETSFERMLGNLPQIIALVGDAGSGKSRLLYEFRSRIDLDSCVLLEGRCSALTQSVPYAPFVVMFRSYFDLDSSDGAATTCDKLAVATRALDPTLEELYPVLCRLLSVGSPAAQEGAIDEMRRNTFDAIARLVVAISETKPVLLVIEDLHWIDDSSRELLDLAISQLSRAQIMMIVSHRPEFFASWRARVAFTRLALRPFSEDESRQMIRAVAGTALPEELERRILEKAEGSPFFTEELVRALVEDGFIIPDGDRHRLTRPLDEVFIPGTVRELIAARLDRLGVGAKRVAQIGSVLGRQFRREQLVALAAGEPLPISASLVELEQKGILHRKNALNPDEFRFGESLTQEVAYDGLLHRDRRQLHERAARLLAQEGTNGGPQRLLLIAHHWARSDDRRRAAEALLAAARETERLPSYRTAAGYYRSAWEMAAAAIGADESDESLLHLAMTAALELARMAVVYVMPDGVDVEAAGRRGREIAERLGDLEAQVRFDSSLGHLAMNSSSDRFPQGLELVERAHAAALRNGFDALALNLSRSLAAGYFFDGRLADALRLVDPALTEVVRQSAGQPLPDFYFGLRWVRCGLLSHLDDFRAAREYTLETLRQATAVHNRTARAGLASLIASLHQLAGETQQAKAWADEGLEIAEAIGNVTTVRLAAAVALAARAELGESESLPRYLRAFEETLATPMNVSLYVRTLIGGLLAADRVDLAARVVAEAFPQSGGRLRRMLVEQANADVEMRLGRFAEARAAAERALVIARDVGSRTGAAFAHRTLGNVGPRGEDSDAHTVAAERTFRELGLHRYLGAFPRKRATEEPLPA